MVECGGDPIAGDYCDAIEVARSATGHTSLRVDVSDASAPNSGDRFTFVIAGAGLDRRFEFVDLRTRAGLALLLA